MVSRSQQSNLTKTVTSISTLSKDPPSYLLLTWSLYEQPYNKKIETEKEKGEKEDLRMPPPEPEPYSIISMSYVILHSFRFTLKELWVLESDLNLRFESPP